VGAEENIMSRNLSQIVADLFAKPTEGEDQSSRIKRLRDEAKIVIGSEDTVFGRLRGLLESFRGIIPDEKQRYLAALQALSTTSKLGPQEIVKAVNGQLEEMKVLEKGLMPTLPGWRNELKTMEARSQQLKGEMAQLRERIAQLESEEKTVLTGIAAREKELELAEKSMKDLFADIEAEVTSIKKKVEEFTAEAPAAQPSPKKEPQKIDVPIEKKVEIQTAPPPVDTKFERKCPMCGGRFNLLELEKKWQCYTCAYEETTMDDVQSTSEEKSDSTSELTPDPDRSPSVVEPSASMADEYQGSKKRTSPSDDRPSTRKKTCPACRKTMFWFPDENAWRCPSCHYLRRI
jgi:ribosomal protein S27AE